MNPPLRIELFGGLQIVRGSGDVTSRFPTRKTAALLAYLAYNRGKIISREVLTDILWPDADPVSSRNSFRVALNSLRRQLEPSEIVPGTILCADRTHVHLDISSCVTDVAEFDEAIRKEKNGTNDAERRDALAEAADAYKGPLLVGWYEEWIDFEQTRLAELYAGVIRRLTELLMRNQEFDRAVEYAHQAVRADPLREEASRNLIRIYATIGQTAEAFEQYKVLDSHLQTNLGLRPSAATRQLMKEIALPPAGQVVSTDDRERSTEATRASAASDRRDRRRGDRRTTAGTEVRGSVPIQLTRFFGRESELSELRELLRPDASRLVTITGPGGTGKTRLSIEAASRVRDVLYNGRAWVVPLSTLTDASQILSALLGILRIMPQPDLRPEEQIKGTLGAAPALLVLDNLEQIADTSGPVIQDLLTILPHVTILATSRQALGIMGESEYPLAPLPLPASPVARPERLSSFASVALFVDRARNVRPDFQITAKNAAAVSEICRRLDGLPLAIELAAASARLLSPQQMLDRLKENFEPGLAGVELQGSGRLEFSPRHRSLRVVMDNSYDLLPDDLKHFFAQLSVFRGGWTLAAAENVCGNAFALDLLDSLSHRSLVFMRETENGMRFFFLETIRQYAESKLSDTGREELRRRHCAWYADVAKRAGQELNGPESQAWCDVLENDHDNIRAVLAASSQDDPAMALELAAALWRFWYARGFDTEGATHIASSLGFSADTDGPPMSVSDLLLVEVNRGGGRLALSQGATFSAVNYFCAALAALDRAASSKHSNPESDLNTRSMLFCDIAIASEARADLTMAAWAYRELITIYRSECDPWAEACALSALAMTLQASGQSAAASEALSASVALRIRAGDQVGAEEAKEMSDSSHFQSAEEAGTDPAAGADAVIAASYLQLGHIASERGDEAAAIPLLFDAVESYESAGDALGAAIASERIAVAALRQNDRETARRAIDDALLSRGRAARLNPANVRLGETSAFARSLLARIERL